MHPDHWRATYPKTGRRLFPNAELVVQENEPRHWNDDAAMAKASERARKLYFQCAREQMAPYHNVMHTFSDSVEVFPGVTSVLLHGHTPGHSGYMISSGKESLLIWGDIVHVPDIQIPRPEVTIEFDTDPHAAAATRKRVLDMVATRSATGCRNAYALSGLPMWCSKLTAISCCRSLGTRHSDSKRNEE
jgi:glyoxylase-like metal-dependent hydrolase (beta-lactamase superfamily II)